MARKLSFSVDAGADGLRLDQLLARELPRRFQAEVSRRRARRLIAAGAVYVDGRRTRIASRPVSEGRRVDVWVDGGTAVGPATPRSEIDVGVLVLYEDQHLLAVDKPSGIAVQATVDDDAGHLLARVRAFLARRSGRWSPYLALPHRLDRGTSGVQLLAKTRSAAAALSAAFRERRVDKIYLALCDAALCAAGGEELADEWTVRDRLVLRQMPGGGRRAVSVDGGGRPAETRFAVRERLPGGLLVLARPRTGRTHQIRVHLAGSGAPVLGDRLYGDPGSGGAPRLMLHAAELHLRHPAGGGPLDLESPLPADFRERLQELRRSASMASP